MLRWDVLVTERWGDTILDTRRIPIRRRFIVRVGSESIVLARPGATRRVRAGSLDVSLELVPRERRLRRSWTSSCRTMMQWLGRALDLVGIGLPVVWGAIAIVANAPFRPPDPLVAVEALIDHEPTAARAVVASSEPIGMVVGPGILGPLTANNADLNAIFAAGSLERPTHFVECDGQRCFECVADCGIGSTVGIGGEDTVIIGSLDPAIIDAVVKRHLAQIQYCYERELPAKPKLSGKIVESFTIEADGRVSQARTRTSTMDGGGVEGCISDRFKTILFPKPKGGGIVTVDYPLLLTPSMLAPKTRPADVPVTN